MARCANTCTNQKYFNLMQCKFCCFFFRHFLCICVWVDGLQGLTPSLGNVPSVFRNHSIYLKKYVHVPPPLVLYINLYIFFFRKKNLRLLWNICAVHFCKWYLLWNHNWIRVGDGGGMGVNSCDVILTDCRWYDVEDYYMK